MWSRESAGSATSVTPAAWRPASSRAVFTWALATASSWRIAMRPPPRMASGASRPPSRPSMRAPMARSGSTTRAMGRRTTEASPVSTEWKGRPARSPASSRIDVPELPQSRMASGSVSPAKPAPRTITTGSARSPATTASACEPAPLRTLTPRASMAARLRTTSSPSASPHSRLVSEARAQKSRARCEIDLSPGTRSRPRSGRSPWNDSSAGSAAAGPAPAGVSVAVTPPPGGWCGTRGRRARRRWRRPRRRARPSRGRRRSGRG